MLVQACNVISAHARVLRATPQQSTTTALGNPNQLLSNVPSPPTPRMPWPAYVSNTFDAIPGGVNGATDESLFYGPYNTLLTYLFPPTDNYMISPQFKQPPEGWSINFTTVFIVQRAFHPVCFLEIKPPGDYTHRSSHAAADDQMRTRFFDLADVVELPVIHGVSALGTRLCFYSYARDNNVLDPPRIPPDVERMNDVAPAA